MLGGYMARDRTGHDNPGQRYIRLALVHDPAETEAGLRRVAAHS